MRTHPSSPGLRAIAALVVLAAVTFPSGARADEIPVPIELQAELLSKVTTYERGGAAQSTGVVHVLLVAKADDPSSAPAILQMQRALSRVSLFGRVSHVEQVVEYVTAAALADTCRTQHAAIVYFGPGFGDDVAAIRQAFESTNTLTVAAMPADVPHGLVLGFDLVSGKTKLLFNLAQARKQGVALKAEVLKLMRIYE